MLSYRIQMCSSSTTVVDRMTHLYIRRIPMFLFFSNRLGCLGSIAVSAVLTLILLLIFGVI